MITSSTEPHILGVFWSSAASTPCVGISSWFSDITGQDLSYDLETGCPKLAISNVKGVPFFLVEAQYTQISTINMHKMIEIRHTILIQCHGNYIVMTKFSYMLEIDMQFLTKNWVSWGVVFKDLGVWKTLRRPAGYRLCYWVTRSFAGP